MTETKRQGRYDRPTLRDDQACSTCLVTSLDAAEMLAISTTKLAELTKAGEIPCVRIGRAVRYDRKDLNALIERSKTRQ